jgi:catechol 2,3-dioxygenase-like lactoylglutathione lyase family enzyme
MPPLKAIRTKENRSMLSKSNLVAFAATAKPARAKKFYGSTLGLRLVSEDQFALAFDANGTQLRVQIVEKVNPLPYTALGWAVADIGKTVKKLTRAKVKFERYPFLEQDELRVWIAPSGAKVAWFKDPDGNLLSLTQYPRSRRA